MNVVRCWEIWFPPKVLLLMNENIENVPQINENQSLMDFTEGLTNEYIKKTCPLYRKKKGQYFTPKVISEFMAEQFDGISKKKEIRILDPGAGIGIFESAFCEYIKSQGKNMGVFFDIYENDDLLKPLLDLNMRLCQENMVENGYEISYRICDEDFILSNSPIFNDESNDFDLGRDGYDFIIANPPYYKLQKTSPHAIVMKNIINGQTNIYVLFMALSGKLLKYGGQITALTPRSYFSGLYFEKFREWFFRRLKPTKIHVFGSREVFKKYNVRQEMVVLTAMKSFKTPESVIISTSSNGRDSFEVLEISYEEILVRNNGNILIRVPTSELDKKIAGHLDRLGFRLDKLGLKASTGPVVPFREKSHLLNNIDNLSSFSPLIWMQNLRDGKVKWPIQLSKKPIAVENTERSNKLLIPNGNYVLIKRFSTKEGKRRINAHVILDKSLDSDYLGIENHVNYIYKVGGTLTENETYGIASLLNSKLYNRYFQMINGSTQVNVSEINNIPLPSLEKIRLIGSLTKGKNKNNEIEEIIMKELNIHDNFLLSELIE